MKLVPRLVSFSLLAAFSLSIAACGGEKAEPAKPATAATAAAAATGTPAKKAPAAPASTQGAGW